MWNIEATINDGISWELFPVYWWRGKGGALACFNQSSINIIHGWTDIWTHRLDPSRPGQQSVFCIFWWEYLIYSPRHRPDILTNASDIFGIK